MLKYFLFLTTIISAALCACTRDGEWYSAQGAVWGTTYHIVYQSDKNLDDVIIKAMATIDDHLSVFNSKSTVSKINAAITDTVSQQFADVMKMSKRVNALSDGAFDPTVGPLIALWGFGEKGHDTPAPDSLAIAEALQGVGIGECRIEGNILKYNLKRRPQFNFSAIAKGYGVDCVANALRDNGCKNFIVEIGGEVVTSGHNANHQDWHVQIDAPDYGNQHNRLTVITLNNAAIATSGNYRNYRTLADGSRVGHTISPKTGYPVVTNLLSVSIIAPTCMEADALATACMAMSFKDAKAMISNLVQRQAEITAYFVTDDGMTTIGLER